MKKYNIIFLGTPEIAKCALAILNNIEWINIIFVVSQPDRMKDRKNNIVYQEVKQYCLVNNLKIYQPEKISEIKEEILIAKPDAIITCAYGQFVPETILNIPKYGAFNFHASLLPKLRGGAPIHYAIINGFKQTGWTLMKMIKQMDAGDYCAQTIIDIKDEWTMKDLYLALCSLLNNFILDNLSKIFDSSTKWIKQDESQITFAYNITKEQSIINFNQDARTINNLIKGLYDKPIAIWCHNNIEIKVYDSYISNIKSIKQPGEISLIDKNGIFISTKDFDIVFTTIKFPSKNIIKIKDVYHNKKWLQELLNEKI